MKKRSIQAKNLQVGDQLVRQNVLGQDVTLTVVDVTHGYYVFVDYLMSNQTTWKTHYYPDEIISIVDNNA